MKEVLLKENIEHLGYRGEVVKVADGYARNYLLPRNLAMPVTKSNQRQIELAQAAAAKIEASEREEAKTLATRIEGVQCVIARRVGEMDPAAGNNQRSLGRRQQVRGFLNSHWVRKNAIEGVGAKPHL